MDGSRIWPSSSSARSANGVWNGLVVIGECTGAAGSAAGTSSSGRFWKTSESGILMRRPSMARPKAGRKRSVMPRRMSSMPISTRPEASCGLISSPGTTIRTLSGTLTGSKPRSVGLTSRSTARRLRFTSGSGVGWVEGAAGCGISTGAAAGSGSGAAGAGWGMAAAATGTSGGKIVLWGFGAACRTGSDGSDGSTFATGDSAAA